MTILEIIAIMALVVPGFAAGWLIWATSSNDRNEIAVRQVRWLRWKLGRRSR